jgi:hypothetical protein
MTQTKTAAPAVFELVPTQALALASPAPSLDDLTATIQHSHREAIAAVARGAWFAIQAGHALIAAKAMLKAQRLTGMWEEYVAVQCHMPLRTAQHYMYLAKHEDKLRQLVAPDAQGNAFISQAQALKLLGAARAKRRRPARAGAGT